MFSGRGVHPATVEEDPYHAYHAYHACFPGRWLELAGEEPIAMNHILGIWVVSQPPPSALINSTLASIRR
jgi:hypothetical protein